MKTFLILLLSVVLLGGSVFGHLVVNDKGEEVSYFSSQNPLLSVITTNSTNITISSYYSNNTLTNNTFETQSCDEGYCYSFSGLTYTQYVDNFTVFSNQSEVTIFKDDINPEINNLSVVLDEDNKSINFSFLIRDNSEIISSSQLYVKEENDFVFEANLENKTEYVYNLSSSGDKEFLFKVVDQARNSLDYTLSKNVPDIFEPEILSYLLIKDLSGGFSLVFEAEDDISLAHYSIIQDSLSIEESLNQSNVEKEVGLPFESGDMILRVRDSSDNLVEENISLSSDIVTSSFKRATNKNIFSFSSNADLCVVTQVNGEYHAEEMEKDGSSFELTLSLNENSHNNIEFYCERNNVREFDSSSLIYDTIPPENVNLSAEADENGEINLRWDASSDNLGDVRYRVLRNEEVILETDSTSFRDFDVSYPNEYEYSIEVRDEAGNSVMSNSEIVVPKKVDIFLGVDIFENKTEENISKLNINTEENNNVSVTVKSEDDEIIFEESFVMLSNSTDLEIPLKLGLNDIEILVKDSYDNTNSFRSSIYRQQKSGQVIEREDSSLAGEQITERENSSVSKEEVIEDSQSSIWWVWFIGFLGLFALFVFVFIYNEDILRRYARKKQRNATIYERKRKEDAMLGKSLDDARQKRIEKQRRAEEKKRREEAKKKEKKQYETKYQQKKYEDISKSNARVNPLKKSNSKENSVFKDRVDSLANYFKLASLALQTRVVDSTKKKKEKVVEPEKKTIKRVHLDDYLQNKSSNSWSSPQEYRQKIEEKEPEGPLPEEEVKPESEIKEEAEKDIKNEEKKGSFFKKSKKEDSSDKLGLNDYLNKRVKKKKRYFVEKEVENELKKN